MKAVHIGLQPWNLSQSPTPLPTEDMHVDKGDIMAVYISLHPQNPNATTNGAYTLTKVMNASPFASAMRSLGMLSAPSMALSDVKLSSVLAALTISLVRSNVTGEFRYLEMTQNDGVVGGDGGGNGGCCCWVEKESRAEKICRRADDKRPSKGAVKDHRDGRR